MFKVSQVRMYTSNHVQYWYHLRLSPVITYSKSAFG